ncbi:MAG: CPBP family glutamic-type intramembrane protease [Promethearchaeota archaeon]
MNLNSTNSEENSKGLKEETEGSEGSEGSKSNLFKICDECGAKLSPNARFCKICGKNFAPINHSDWKVSNLVVVRSDKKATDSSQSNSSQSKEQRYISNNSISEKLRHLNPVERVCPKCNVIIRSRVLLQCPECMEKLPPLPQQYMVELSKQFSQKYSVQPKEERKELPIKKEEWNKMEAFNVLFRSFMLYIMIQLVIVSIIIYSNPELFENSSNIEIPITIPILFLERISSFAFLIYPLYYMKKNNLKLRKFGLKTPDNPLKIYSYSIIFGVLLYLAESALAGLLAFLNDLGFSFLAKPSVYETELNLIESMPFNLLFLYIMIIILATISEEMTFRGVLHKGLMDDDESNERKNKKWRRILAVALIYSLIFFLLSFNFYGFILNLAISVIIGILFENVKGNLFGIILAIFVYGFISIIAILF